MKINKYSIIYKFLMVHFFKSFGLIFLGISGIIGLFSVINNLKKFTNTSVPFGVTMQFSLLDVFYTLNTVLPLSVLLGGILTFWRLSRTSELTVIRSIGFSVWQFLAPILVVCIGIGVLNMSVLSPINAALAQRVKKLTYRYEIGRSNPLLFSQEGLWLKEKSDFTQSFINIDYVKRNGNVLNGKNAVIYITDLDNNFLKRVKGKDVVLNNDGLNLNDVEIINPTLIKDNFETYNYPTNLTIDRIEENSSKPETFSFWELPGFISFFENAGFSARKHKSYFYSLLFMPLTLCAMLFISSIFSISPKRNQSNLVLKLSGGILIGFGVFFLNQIINAMGASGRISILLSAITIPITTILVCVTILLYSEDG